MTDKRRLKFLIGLNAVSGAMHFAMPKPYEKIVPPQFGDAKKLVLLSGAAELACAALLAAPKTRRLGALLSAGLYVGVFPANVYAVKVIGTNPVARAGSIARLPLQIPMITSALKVARAS